MVNWHEVFVFIVVAKEENHTLAVFRYPCQDGYMTLSKFKCPPPRGSSGHFRPWILDMVHLQIILEAYRVYNQLEGLLLKITIPIRRVISPQLPIYKAISRRYKLFHL